jgi:hypothetical protein
MADRPSPRSAGIDAAPQEVQHAPRPPPARSPPGPRRYARPVIIALAPRAARLDHVSAAAHAAIEQHLDLAADGLGDGQSRDRSGQKKARSSRATCSGSSCAMKCPPRCGVL